MSKTQSGSDNTTHDDSNSDSTNTDEERFLERASPDFTEVLETNEVYVDGDDILVYVDDETTTFHSVVGFVLKAVSVNKSGAIALYRTTELA